MTTGEKHFGYILVTTNPYMSGGSLGIAFDLVKARLEKGEWPLFENTRCRERIVEGTRVAFYVAGKRAMSGKIVAVAVVDASRRFRVGSEPVDPRPFVTDHPHTVLSLRDIQMLEPPVDMKEAMPTLSIQPADMKNWGSVLQGGVRGLNEKDWKILFRE